MLTGPTFETPERATIPHARFDGPAGTHTWWKPDEAWRVLVAPWLTAVGAATGG